MLLYDIAYITLVRIVTLTPTVSFSHIVNFKGAVMLPKILDIRKV